MQKLRASLIERITTDPTVRFGNRAYGPSHHSPGNFGWLSSGTPPDQILSDYPQLEPDDFLAVYAYAVQVRPIGNPPPH